MTAMSRVCEPKLQRRPRQAAELPHRLGQGDATFRMLAHARSANLRSALTSCSNRKEHRPPVYPVLAWRCRSAFCLSLIAVSVLMLDAPLASFRGLWSPALVSVAERMTDIGWSGWYIIPSGSFCWRST